MNTDWNSPQGDFDTAEKQGELLMLLSRQQVTVHTAAAGHHRHSGRQGGRTEPVYGKRLAGHGAVHRAARRRGCRCGAQALLAGGKAGRRPACGQSAGAGVLGPGTEPEMPAPGGIIEQKGRCTKCVQRPFLIQFVVFSYDLPYSLQMRRPQRPVRCPALRRRGHRWGSAHRGTAG